MELPTDVNPDDLGGDDTEDVNWRGRPELVWMYLHEELECLRMFATAAGRLGLAFYNVHPGDRVVLFAGGNMPFLVRSAGASYELISVCYVHGAVDGELWPGEDCLYDIELL